MSFEANSAFDQWILPSSELKNAYKQGYPEPNATITDEEYNIKKK
jgi:hypothetical protein